MGGGLPVGVLCGKAALMKRFRDDRPADICFARGTFNSHPYVMGAMDAFLRRMETAEGRALYDGLGARCAALRQPAPVRWRCYRLVARWRPVAPVTSAGAGRLERERHILLYEALGQISSPREYSPHREVRPENRPFTVRR